MCLRQSPSLGLEHPIEAVLTDVQGPEFQLSLCFQSWDHKCTSRFFLWVLGIELRTFCIYGSTLLTDLSSLWIISY